MCVCADVFLSNHGEVLNFALKRFFVNLAVDSLYSSFTSKKSRLENDIPFWVPYSFYVESLITLGVRF